MNSRIKMKLKLSAIV